MNVNNQFRKMFEECQKLEIHKMTVKEFAEASENNPLWNASIWTKAYHMEAQLKEVKAMLIKRVDPAKILEAMNK